MKARRSEQTGADGDRSCWGPSLDFGEELWRRRGEGGISGELEPSERSSRRHCPVREPAVARSGGGVHVDKRPLTTETVLTGGKGFVANEREREEKGKEKGNGEGKGTGKGGRGTDGEGLPRLIFDWRAGSRRGSTSGGERWTRAEARQCNAEVERC